MVPSETIRLFDAYLAKKKKKFEAVVIGAGALNLLGTVVRETKDIDVIDGDRGRRGPDWNDIKAMKPTQEEMKDALSWAIEQDGNPSWPDHVRILSEELMKELYAIS